MPINYNTMPFGIGRSSVDRRRPGPGPLQPEGRRERAPRLGAARRRAERPQRGCRGVELLALRQLVMFVWFALWLCQQFAMENGH